MKILKKEKTNNDQKVTSENLACGDDFVEVNGVYKLFEVKSQKVPVLKGITTKIKKGDFVIIFGPSGCGKTTLLNTILGFETPSKGGVKLLGEDIYSIDEDRRAEVRKRNLGIIYQQPNWIKSISVIDNVTFPLLLLGIRKHIAMNIAAKALQDVGMYEWRNYKPTELSAGQQQKIALARALAPKPKILIADEPTGNLDHKSSVDLMQTMEKLNATGITIIMVTHNIDQLTSANRVIQMSDGSVVKDHDLSNTDKQEVIKTILNTHEDDLNLKVNQSVIDDLMKQPTEIVEKNKKGLKLQRKRITLNRLIHRTYRLITFMPIVFAFLAEISVTKLVSFVTRDKIIALNNFFGKNRVSAFFSRTFDREHHTSISRLNIVRLTTQELIDKKSRTFITVIGMSVGIGLIVFLVSIGYGVERIVISRIADLEQRKQIEAFPIVGTNQRLNDQTVNKLQDLNEVERILPQMSIVSKIEYNNSNTDVVSYGVQADYINKSDINIVEGKVFSNNELNNDTTPIVNVLSETDTATTDNTGTSADLTAQEQEAASLAKISTEISNKLSEDKSTKQIVANTTLLEVLGISTKEAVGQTLDISFVIGELDTDLNKRIVVDPVQYQISGVVEYGDTPIIYLPLIELKTLGIKNYSQVKLVLDQIDSIPVVKDKIKVLGYNSISIEDTIVQIQNFFNIVRVALGIIGLGGLLIASFGMFNTLTISLLERTREIGLMKAIGMKSDEVFDLFAAQSLTMGILGGIIGLVLGYLLGTALTLIVSAFSISNGAEFIQLTYVPWGFVLIALILSSFVGILTGYYPAKRATNISAMDALRYE